MVSTSTQIFFILIQLIYNSLSFSIHSTRSLTFRFTSKSTEISSSTFPEFYKASRNEDDLFNSKKVNFDYLRVLKERCTALIKLESEYMLSFWSPNLKCFQIYPNLDIKKPSIITTCMSIDTILSSPECWENICRWDAVKSSQQTTLSSVQHPSGSISLQSIIDSLKSHPWSGEPFQTSMLITTLCKLKVFSISDTKCRDAMEIVISQRSRVAMHRKQPYSAYLRHLNVRAMLSIVENDPSVASDFKLSSQLGYALERSNMVSFDELCRQLAFYNSGDSTYFDVIILSYSLLAYVETSESLFLNSYAKGVIPPTNMKLVKSALEVIFANQAMDGTWRKGEPIYSNFGGSTGATGTNNRDIGNSYVFFFDLIEKLLGPLAEKTPEVLVPYLPNLERCLSWAETNVLQEMLPEDCDPETQFCYGRIIKGWRSNHLGTGGAVGWCTAQVFSAVNRLSNLLQILINTSILTEFRGRKALAIGNGNPKNFEGLMDSDLALAGERTSLKIEIFQRLLQPQIDKEQRFKEAFQAPNSVNAEESLSVSTKNTYYNPVYSAILFGPPGTAKTTFCTSIASYLGWNFLTIDTAMFLSNGLEQIASRMTYIFDRLKLLDKTIILFDEIEEFCLDRENPNITMESRLLTTAILTQLNDLRRQQSCIFIVATNRLRSFDAAVTRPGRFDMVLFVGTPNLPSRVKRLEEKLKTTRGLQLSESDFADVMKCFTSVLDKNWDQMRYMTFAENEALINGLIELQGRQKLSKKSLVNVAEILMRTATIQGPIREEYESCEVLSRA